LKVFYLFVMKIFFFHPFFKNFRIALSQYICWFTLYSNLILELHYPTSFMKIHAGFEICFFSIILDDLWKIYLALKKERKNYFSTVIHCCYLEFTQNFEFLFSFSCFEISGLVSVRVNQLQNTKEVQSFIS